MGLIAEFRGGFFHTSVLFFIQATLFHTIFINTSKWSVLWLCTLSPLGPGTPVTPSGPRSPWRWKRLYFRNEIEKSSFDPLKWRSLPWGRLCLVCPDLQHLLPNPKRLKTITDDYETIVWNEVWTKPGKVYLWSWWSSWSSRPGFSQHTWTTRSTTEPGKTRRTYRTLITHTM